MSNDPLRPLVLEAWHAVDREERPAHDALRQVFRRARKLTSAQRERIVETLETLLRERRRVFFALEQAGLDDLPKSRKSDALYLAARVLGGSMTAATAAHECPGIQWDVVDDVDQKIDAIADADTRLGLRYSLPELLLPPLRDVAERAGTDLEKLLAALRKEPPTVLRANTLKTTREKLLRELKEIKLNVFATRLADSGVVLKEFYDLHSLDAYQRGWFEIQDESSQLCAKLVAPPPHGVTVDFCAGAGGKTLALAAQLNGRGRLVALDRHAGRLAELKKRGKRAGVANLQVLELPEKFHSLSEIGALKPFIGKAERVLVDAPCSGTGVLARKPEIRWRITREELERLPLQQEAIARTALELVVPGGRLIYATCSLLRAENEAVVERLLADGNLTLVPPKEILGGAFAAEIADASGQYMKLLPHLHKTDGFFAAVLRKKK